MTVNFDHGRRHLSFALLLHPLEALLFAMAQPSLLVLDGLDVNLLDLELDATELNYIVFPQLVVKLLIISL